MATLAVPSSHPRHPHSNVAASASAPMAPPSSSSHSYSYTGPSSSGTASTASTTTTSSTKGTKLRTHLLALLPLLPKHALFHAKLTIHELASVPFLDGEFATKWRFKNAHSIAGAAAGAAHAGHGGQGQGQGLGGGSTQSLVERAAGRVRRMGSYNSLRGASAPVLDEAAEQQREREREAEEEEGSPESSDSSEREQRGGRTTPMPGDRPPASVSSRPGTSHSYASTSTSGASAGGQYGPYLHPPAGRPPISAQPSYLQNPPQPQPGSINFVSQPKGQTPYLPLKKHTVVWSYDVDAAVQISIGRSSGPGGGGGGGSAGESAPSTPGFNSPAAGATFTPSSTAPGRAAVLTETEAPGGAAGKEPGWLQPCELKLTVVKYLQEWERKDELAREGMVLGSVVLNLAEYVGEGLVTRRYLLRDSKTNATLKLSIEMVQIGGETRYRAPPLQKGQILGSVAGLMSDDHMRRHARSPLLRATSSGSSSSSLYLPPTHTVGGQLSVHPPPGHRRTGSAQSMPAPSAMASGPRLTAPHPHLPTPAYPSPAASPSASPYPASSSFSPGPASPSVSHSHSHSRSPSASASAPGAHQPQSTESIIEALFNPFPSQNPAPSPFTYYKPPQPTPSAQGAAEDPDAAAADGSEVGDEEGTGGEEGSTADESAQAAGGGGGGGGGKKRRWWRKTTTTSSSTNHPNTSNSNVGATPSGGGGRRPAHLDFRSWKGRSNTQLAPPVTAGSSASAASIASASGSASGSANGSEAGSTSSTPRTAGTGLATPALSAVSGASGASGVSTVTPGTARGSAQGGRWKWR